MPKVIKNTLRILTASAFVGAYFFSLSSVQAADKVLEIELPKPKFSGTPVPIKGIPHLEKKAQGARPEFKVPADVELVSDGKEVTSSDDWPIIGELEFLTDGDKDADEGYYVELGPELQWVQIDLEGSKEIFAIALWHYKHALTTM